MPRGLVGVSIFVRLAESIYRKSNFEEFSKYLDRVRVLFIEKRRFKWLLSILKKISEKALSF